MKLVPFYLRLCLLPVALLVCVCISAAPVIVAIVDPSKWGLDQVISMVVVAFGSFVIGLFRKKPTRKKK